MRRNKYSLIIIWIAVLAVIVVPRVVRERAEQTGCRLLEVIDGDTLSVNYEGEQVSVRLIGVDAPESVHPEESNNSELGKLADQYLRDLMADTTYVYLEFDQEKYDTYDRLLAYVYFSEDATFEESLNYQLVAEGYAINREYKPNVRYANLLEQASRRAAEQGKGLWSQDEIYEIWD